MHPAIIGVFYERLVRGCYPTALVNWEGYFRAKFESLAGRPPVTTGGGSRRSIALIGVVPPLPDSA